MTAPRHMAAVVVVRELNDLISPIIEQLEGGFPASP